MGILGLSKDKRELGYINYCVSFGFAITLNSLLAFAVARRSTKMLQSYRKVFVFHIVIDYCLTLISVLTMVQPIGATLNGDPIFFHIIGGLIYSPPQPWTTILATIAVFFAIYNITTAPVSFIYRYLIICHNYELTTLPFIGLCIFAGIGPLGYASTILIKELSTRNLEDEAVSLFNNSDWLGSDGKPPNFELSTRNLEDEAMSLFNNSDWLGSDGNPPNFGVMYTSKTSVNTYITPVTVFISYSIVIYCTIWISLKMWKLRAMQANSTGRNRRSQSQLQTVLFCQALIPFLTSGVSTLAIQIGKIFGLSQPWWFFYLNLINTWSPVVNPLVALIVIAPYRKFVLHPFNSKVETSSTNVHPQRKHESTLMSNRNHNSNNIIKVVGK
uniref:Uncharacterized protein n=1 Tax=Panagrolaimus sp. ES5 TaxID=591445 RepID=A0AC34G301_9BILA